jgi:hypothetical protein
MLKKLCLVLVAAAAALLVGELALRLLLGPPAKLGLLYYRDAEGEPIGLPGKEGEALAAAYQRGLIELVPEAQLPPGRTRHRFAPGADFYLCYTDAERLAADWLDDRGCVEVKINSLGLREREELQPDNKAPDEKRVVCIGDSFTFGWGIPVEQCWVRLLEERLRESGDNIRTINCGASGAIVADEYATGLEHRFGRFQPDVVVVSLYPNDLVPSMGLCVIGPQPKATGLLVFDYLRLATMRDPLDLDPAHDWLRELLDLPREQGELGMVYGPDKPFEAMWSQQGPQRAIVAMRDWCNNHNSKLVVILWPFLQGLGPSVWHPFEQLHEAVAVYCEQVSVPFLDLLPVLRQTPARELWVTPSDLHANPRAQRLVTPAIAEFVGRQL